MLKELQAEIGVAFLFIAHNLAVVRNFSDRVAVMYLGKIVEIATRERLYSEPRHPYTVALLSAAPVPAPRQERARQRIVLQGEPPILLGRHPGVDFIPAAGRHRAFAPRLSQD